MNPQLSDCLANDILELIILPTEQCNFRCKYCYEQFQLGKMNSSIVSAIKNLLEKRIPDLRYLLISWFGGEPMIEYDTILDIMNYINQLNVDQKVVVHSKMSTNGYLLNMERLENLVSVGVKRYQISFDGDEEEHNRLRLYYDGSPTFDKIWKNIIYAHNTDLDFLIIIRVHMNNGNYISTKNFLGALAEEIKGDKRFKIFIRPLSRLGSDYDLELPILETQDLKQVDEMKKIASELGLFLTKDYNTENKTICHAAKLNSYLIRPNGQIGKCSCDPYNEKNDVGKIQEDGKIVFNQNNLLWWSRGLISMNQEELTCPLYARAH